MLETVISLILAASSSSASCSVGFDPSIADQRALSALSRSNWNADGMVKGMNNLGLPIRTIQLQKQDEPYEPDQYSAKTAWEPFRQLSRVMCGPGTPCESLISLVMLPNAFPDIPRSLHRRAIHLWAEMHLPGFNLVWSNELGAMARYLSNRFPNDNLEDMKINAVGSIEGPLYHRAVGEGFIPLTNHHDLLGHLLAFSIPDNAALTQRFSKLYADLWTLNLRRQRADASAPTDLGMRNYLIMRGNYQRIDQALEVVWNYLQEKRLLLTPPDSGKKAGFGIIGGFGTLFSYFYDHKSKHTPRKIGRHFFPYFTQEMSNLLMGTFLTGPSPDPDEYPQLYQFQLNLIQAAKRFEAVEDEIGIPYALNDSPSEELASRDLKEFSDILDIYLLDPKPWLATLLPLSFRIDRVAKRFSRSSHISGWINPENYLKFWTAYLDMIEAWMKKESYILDQTMPRSSA